MLKKKEYIFLHYRNSSSLKQRPSTANAVLTLKKNHNIIPKTTKLNSKGISNVALGSRLSALGSRLSALRMVLLLTCTVSNFASAQASQTNWMPYFFRANDNAAITSDTPQGICIQTQAHVGRTNFCLTTTFEDSCIPKNGDCENASGYGYVFGECRAPGSIATRPPGTNWAWAWAGWTTGLCACPIGKERFEDTQWCIPSRLKLVLTGISYTRPSFTGGISTANFVAKVTQSGAAKAGIAVSFTSEVSELSGGHDHQGGNRPQGVVNPSSATTDENGEAKFVFQASAFSGVHKISASCSGCSSANGTNAPATAEIQVKVPDLVQFAASTSSPPKHTLRGADSKHSSNHWFSLAATENLETLVKTFNALGWKPVGINDGSLNWGGSFDIDGNWVVGRKHAEHRIGEEVDISFAVGVPPAVIKNSYDFLCRDKKVDIPSTLLWHDIPLNQGGAYPPHFHVRLDGQYTVSPNTGKSAPCSRDSESKKK